MKQGAVAVKLANRIAAYDGNGKNGGGHAKANQVHPGCYTKPGSLKRR